MKKRVSKVRKMKEYLRQLAKDFKKFENGKSS